MSFGIGQHKMRNGNMATVSGQVSGAIPWLIGHFFRGGNPVASRWHPTTGSSSEGNAFDLVSSTGELWVAVYYTRNGPSRAATAPTEAEAEALAIRGGNVRIAVLGPVSV